MSNTGCISTLMLCSYLIWRKKSQHWRWEVLYSSHSGEIHWTGVISLQPEDMLKKRMRAGRMSWLASLAWLLLNILKKQKKLWKYLKLIHHYFLRNWLWSIFEPFKASYEKHSDEKIVQCVSIHFSFFSFFYCMQKCVWSKVLESCGSKNVSCINKKILLL